MNHLAQKNVSHKNAKNHSAFYEAKTLDLEIQALIKNASKCLSPVWPLETFIACNPLQGFESYPFAKALSLAGFSAQTPNNDSGLAAVNLQMIKWCANFFDKGQSVVAMPYKEKGLYQCFLKLACFDKQLHQNQQEHKNFLQHLPQTSEEAILLCFSRLGVDKQQQQDFLVQTFMYLPGWAGYLKWQTDWRNTSSSESSCFHLMDFIAVRLVITCLLWPQAVKEQCVINHDLVVQDVIEKLITNEDSYRHQLLQQIFPVVNSSHPISERFDAQLVFCIDVRSEPFRRSIESLGNYDTYGFAGFFGIPVRVHEFESSHSKDCCPVLLKPRFAIKENPVHQASDLIASHQQGLEVLTIFKNFYSELKYNFSTPFALVESIGAWCGMLMTLKSITPRLSHAVLSKTKTFIKPDLETTVHYELDPKHPEHGISLKEQIAYAETVLRLMGLTQHFAKLIVLCGHGSTTENNPYASALDCGACGGNHGGLNAKLLASILNKSEIRQALEERGIHIPLDTVFYSALHNTTTDEVRIFDAEHLVSTYPDLLTQLIRDLNQAKQLTNQERAIKLNHHCSKSEVGVRSLDWSETRPEWGLAQNAAFIVAPRYLTRHIHLDGRCFLHSYDWIQDDEGSLLETILTAPMVVAQWINNQYLFSTLDNVAYGSGSKITHNVTGKIGVMQGNGSDLMHGLPLQSVMSSDEQEYHRPQRLLSLVYAPRHRVFNIIEKQTVLKTLFFNEWIHLVVIDPEDHQAYQLNPTGDWSILN